MELRGPNITLFIFFFFAVFSLPQSARADEILKPTEVTDSPIDELGARKTTRPTQIVPKEQIQSELRPFNDSLNALPGVQSRLNGSPTISIRGSLSSARTLVLTDGAPLNFADGAGFNLLFIASENIEKIVLLRGPASTLFGHDALSGAIDFETEKLNALKFFGSYASFDTTQVFAGAPFSVAGAQAQVTAYQTHDDGNFPYTTQAGFSGLRTFNDQETVRSTVAAKYDGEVVQWKTYNLIARQIGSTPGALNFPFPSSFNNWGELSHLSVSVKLGDSFKIGSRSTFKYIYQDYPSYGTPSTTQSIKEGLSLLKKWGDHQVEFFEDNYYEQFIASYLGSGQSTEVLTEGGVSDFFSLTENIVIQPAVRVASGNGGLIPSLGIIGSTKNQWKFFANYSEGFHPPSITQLYSQSPQFVGNPNLVPEHSTETDLGVEKNFGEILTRAEVFDRNIYNQFSSAYQSLGVLTTQNVGHGHADGIELTGDSHYAGASFSYLQNSFVDTGNPVLLSPRVQVSVHGGAHFGFFSFLVQDTFWSDYYDNNLQTGGTVNLHSWNTLDIFLTARLSKVVDLKATILNILDQPRELTFNYPEPQRSYSVMIQGYL